MALCVVHICGPRRAGKTTAAQHLARMLRDDPPFHVRMVPAAQGVTTSMTVVSQMDGMCEARMTTYTSERLFEQLPAALKAIKQKRRWATVLLETDPEPAFRQASPYDVRAFVAPQARDLYEVFRTPSQAAEAMNSIMQDTQAFAREIYGLIPDGDLDGSQAGSLPAATRASGDPLTDTQMRHLLSSSVGGAIAARVQFQPDYHALVESDVVMINSARGGKGSVAEDVAARVDKVLAKLPHAPGREPMLAVCDLLNAGDPLQQLAFGRIAALIAEVKADWP